MIRVAEIVKQPLNLPLEGQGYDSGYGLVRQIDNLLLRLVLDDGTFGIGEVARWPYAAPADYCAEDRALSGLRGVAFTDLPEVVTELARTENTRAIAAGLDMAVGDLSARRAGSPLSVMLGGSLQADVPETRSLMPVNAAKLARVISDDGNTYASIQIKLSRSNSSDITLVRTALEAKAPGQRLMADFNSALSLAEARSVLSALSHDDLLWEEPCAAFEDNLTLVREGFPVMLDQCLGTLDHYRRAADAGARYLVIKPPPLGGISMAQKARDICVAAGIMMRIDAPYGGRASALACLHLALSVPPHLLIGCNDPSLPVKCPEAALSRPRPGRLAPPPGPGLGLEPAPPMAACFKGDLP